MQKRQKTLFWALILSESTHVFCCVLPTLFSMLSLLAGLGMVTAMPPGLEWLHERLHEWELPMIVLSGLILCAAWGLDWYARKVDCHDTGCHHGACEPKKNTAHIVLIAATILFVVNVFVYGVFHRGMGFFAPAQAGHSQDHHDH